MDELDEVKRYAYMYLSEGISLVPVPYGQKKTEISWKKYQDILPTNKNLDMWFGKVKKNIAIICGQVSDLVVLDFDSPESYKVCMTEELEKKFLVVITHGGNRHVYIRTNDNVPSSKDLKLKFEVHSDGTYVIAPPSLHPSQSKYIFEKDFNSVKEYFETVYFDGDYIKDLISKFKDKLTEYYGKRKVEEPKDDAKVVDFPKGYPCYEGVFKNGAIKGERDESAIRIASFLKKKRVKRDSITEHLVNWNEKNYELVNGEKISYPLTAKEIMDKIKSADRGYEYSCSKLRELDSFAKYCDEDACRLKKTKEVKDFKKTILELTEKVIIRPGKTVYYDIHIGNRVYSKSYKDIIKPNLFSEWYMANFHVCFTRISKANWDSIVNTWMKSAETSEEENISDDDIIIDSIIEKLRTFDFIDNVTDCLSGTNVFQCNGGVLVYNNIIRELLNKECKKFGIRISLRELANMMKEFLNGASTIRKVGLHSYRFWQFKPKIFKQEGDKGSS